MSFNILNFYKRIIYYFTFDLYRNLKYKIILANFLLSLVPLFIVITISYFWFINILKQDFYSHVTWQLKNTKQSIEYFISEKFSSLRFISSVYSYEQLKDQKFLSKIFYTLKKESPDIVDLGIIDSEGIQRAYVGPYKLIGKDYSNQDWFNEIIVRSNYLSDVFLGFRKIPHFAITIKKEIPETQSFWIIRATINMDTLLKFISEINLSEKDDAFIINEDGFLQTPSRFNGNILQKVSFQIINPKDSVSIREVRRADGNWVKCGCVSIKNSQWILFTQIYSSPYTVIQRIYTNELLIISFVSVLIGMFIMFGIAQNIVNHVKKADEERENAIAQSEHASKLASIGRLAAGVAHEINNPLAIINEKAGLMKDLLEISNTDMSKNKEKFISLINTIFDSVNRCRTITHRLLGFARRMEVSIEFIDINEAIKEVIGFLEKEFMFKNIRLKLELDETLPLIETDKGQIQQVLLNLLNNAIDAVERDGSVEITTKMKGEDFIHISVKDTGHGIPKEKLKHIFEPFYTTKGKGTGLGLSISYGIIQRLGGKILVESELGKGSIFTIELPIKYRDE